LRDCRIQVLTRDHLKAARRRIMTLTPLHRLWRSLPAGARRAAFARGTALLAPRPDRHAPPARSGIAVGGELGRASGLGAGARLMITALDRLGVACWPFPCEVPLPGEARAPRPGLPPPGVPLVLHVNAPVLPAALLRLPKGFLRGRRVIGYWAWELPVVPGSWRPGAGFVHEIWTPSRFSAGALEPLAPGRVRVVPHPVAASPPKPSALGRADFGLKDNALVILTSLSLASSFERKNPLAAIAAFRAAFGDAPDRSLVMKVVHASHAPDDLARLRQEAAGATNILFMTETMPEADSHALTQAADIVLSLHRSEGFGLVPAEAMLLGRAVVATDFSGTTDFLDASCGIPIPYRLIPAKDPRGVFEAPGAQWADADIGAASAALRRLAREPGLRARLGAAARAQAERRLGAAALAEAVRSLGLGMPAGVEP
jgi:glycosyltransferase involved in cell wall biosynthesis